MVTTPLTGDTPADLRLAWALDTKARQALETEQLGKRALFTDHDGWPPAQVIAAYRCQSEAEGDFRQMKDPDVVGFSPMSRWTDQKICVHAFYCVLGLTITRLMRRQATKAGHPMSARELLHAWAAFTETVLLYPSTGRPRARRMLTEMTSTEQRRHDLLGLGAYAPKR